jgi:hypothetical protein
MIIIYKINKLININYNKINNHLHLNKVDNIEDPILLSLLIIIFINNNYIINQYLLIKQY